MAKKELYCCCTPCFSYLHTNDAINTGNQHPSLPSGLCSAVEKRHCCVYLPSVRVSSSHRNTAALHCSERKGSLLKTLLSAQLCVTNNKRACFIVGLCRGRKYEFCRTVLQIPDGTVAFPECPGMESRILMLCYLLL